MNQIMKLMFFSGNSQVIDSIVSHGCFLNNCVIEHSVVGIRSRINSNVHLKVSINNLYTLL